MEAQKYNKPVNTALKKSRLAGIENRLVVMGWGGVGLRQRGILG